MTGTIAWLDLTVADAEGVRDFYSAVVGWTSEPVPMEGRDDYNMTVPGSGPVAGICHAVGENAGLPAVWLPYVTVADVAAAVTICRDLGGTVIAEPRPMGGFLVAVIRDPAGAAIALAQPTGP